ncbi:MAG: ABC transporter permease, partial [Eubacteriales bacterium]|nr:ABC transporter permease [Eubacteriales bacterium]
QATLESFANTGSLTLIQVNSYKWVESPGGKGGGTSTETILNKKSVEAFKKLQGVKAVMPMISGYGSIKSGQYVTDANILGIDVETANEFGIELESGTLPSPYHGGTSYEIVFGNYVLSNFYSPKNYKPAVDRDGNPKVTIDSRFQMTFDYSNIYNYDNYDNNGNIRPKGKFYKLSPVGVMSSNSNDFSWYCLMDINALLKLAKENKDFMNVQTDRYYQVYVKCNDIDDVKAVKNAIDDMGYGTYSLQDAVEMAQQSTARIQYLLGAIGGVSLLVAAIGIMNTMMMSIYERTKEIGIIKVLGCRMSNIASLFLTESAYIGLFGGGIGLGVSYGLGVLINAFVADSGFKSVIPSYLAVGAVVFSIAVAMISGLYPALRAMRLSPLTAIRTE